MASEQSIEVLISEYATALNNADASKVSRFYAPDAIFMPDKGPTIKSAQRIGKGAGNFFKTQSISISYTIKEIVVDQDFAFVTAHATAAGSDTGQKEGLTRDFFVLKNVSGSWKIFRYIFNAR